MKHSSTAEEMGRSDWITLTNNILFERREITWHIWVFAAAVTDDVVGFAIN